MGFGLFVTSVFDHRFPVHFSLRPLFSFFSLPSHSETRSSISSFLERSQMAFLLMLAVGCTLTFGGEKSAILRQERSLWTAQWLLHSVRNGHWGSKIPFYIVSISLTSSSTLIPPSNFCIAILTCVIVSYTNDYWTDEFQSNCKWINWEFLSR